jgi:hypothetical protein
VRSPQCPLCHAPVGDDDELRAHLASVHDLEDDPGTSTQLEHLEVGYVTVDPSGGRTAQATVLRMHDPEADDARWRPIAIGVGGLVILILAIVALSIGV